jgi:hypothetical protein
VQFAAAAAQLLPLQQQQQQARLIRTSTRPRQKTREPTAGQATEADDYHFEQEQQGGYTQQYGTAGSSRRSAWQQQERWQRQQPDEDWEGQPARPLHRQHQRPEQHQRQQHHHSQQALDEPEQQLQERQQMMRQIKQQHSIGDANRQSSSRQEQQQQQQQQQQRGDPDSNTRRQTSRNSPAGRVWKGISNNSSSSRSRSSSSAGVGAVPAGMTPALLTRAISATSSLPELQQLLSEHKDTLQQINVCAAFKALVRLAGAADSSSSSSSSTATALAVMRHLSNRMLQQMRVARPWDLATAAWACSKVSSSPCLHCQPALISSRRDCSC